MKEAERNDRHQARGIGQDTDLAMPIDNGIIALEEYTSVW